MHQVNKSYGTFVIELGCSIFNHPIRRPYNNKIEVNKGRAMNYVGGNLIKCRRCYLVARLSPISGNVCWNLNFRQIRSSYWNYKNFCSSYIYLLWGLIKNYQKCTHHTLFIRHPTWTTASKYYDSTPTVASRKLLLYCIAHFPFRFTALSTMNMQPEGARQVSS